MIYDLLKFLIVFARLSTWFSELGSYLIACNSISKFAKQRSIFSTNNCKYFFFFVKSFRKIVEKFYLKVSLQRLYFRGNLR